ncbi:hypothetical protein BH11BAC5_BH11BAC5_49340 [soil metagenome]
MKIYKFVSPVYMLLAAGGLKAQSNLSESYSGNDVQFYRMNGQGLLEDRYDPAIEGSPFLNSEWVSAEFVTSTGMLLSISNGIKF